MTYGWLIGCDSVRPLSSNAVKGSKSGGNVELSSLNFSSGTFSGLDSGITPSKPESKAASDSWGPRSSLIVLNYYPSGSLCDYLVACSFIFICGERTLFLSDIGLLFIIVEVSSWREGSSLTIEGPSYLHFRSLSGSRPKSEENLWRYLPKALWAEDISFWAGSSVTGRPPTWIRGSSRFLF